jgi:hypothetical protein
VFLVRYELGLYVPQEEISPLSNLCQDLSRHGGHRVTERINYTKVWNEPIVLVAVAPVSQHTTRHRAPGLAASSISPCT